MSSGEGRENGEKKQQMFSSKKATLHVHQSFFWTFLCRCFARLQSEISRNFLVTLFVEEMSYVFLFTFFPLPLIFHHGGRQHFSFSHRRYKFFMLFFQQKMFSLVDQKNYIFEDVKSVMSLYQGQKISVRWPPITWVGCSNFSTKDNLMVN